MARKLLTRVFFQNSPFKEHLNLSLKYRDKFNFEFSCENSLIHCIFLLKLRARCEGISSRKRVLNNSNFTFK